jgi:hypothetical protein
MVFRANLNRGSDAPACNTPKYELKTISADQLFNSRLNNPTQDAKEIGLDQRDIVMLDAGCGTNVYSGLRKIGKQCRRRRPHFPRLV